MRLIKGNRVYFRGEKCKIIGLVGRNYIISFSGWLQCAVTLEEVKPIITIKAEF